VTKSPVELRIARRYGCASGRLAHPWSCRPGSRLVRLRPVVSDRGARRQSRPGPRRPPGPRASISQTSRPRRRPTTAHQREPHPADQTARQARRTRARLIDLVADSQLLYEEAPDETRCHLNQTFHRRICVDEEHGAKVVRDELKPPVGEIPRATWVYQRQREFTLGGRSTRPVPSPVHAHAGEAAGDERASHAAALLMRPSHPCSPTYARSVSRVSVSWRWRWCLSSGHRSQLSRDIVHT
jgi:hypothetical protein